MEVVLSQKGKRMVIHETFKYRESDKVQLGIKWRCPQKNCPAKIYTDESINTILKKDSNHNHEALAECVLMKKSISNSIKRKASEDICERPSKMINRELANSHSSALNFLNTNDVYNMKKCIYRSRRSKYPINLPKNLSETHQIMNNMTIFTSRNEEFIIANNEENNIIILGCDSNLKFLCECETVYVDGTFDYAPKHFVQFFTIHGVKEGHYIPLVFILLPNKSSGSYISAFEIICQRCLSLELIFKPNNVVVDFEDGIHVAIKNTWPNAIIIGCRFHLSQAWIRNIQRLGLMGEYKETDSQLGRFLRWLFGLTFLAPNEVGDCFAFDFWPYLGEMQITNPNVIKFLDYLTENYISEDSRFPPHIWAAASATSGRTTNCCESFHSNFNKSFYTPHPNIYNFLEILKDFQTATYIKINSVSLPCKITNKKYKNRLMYLQDLTKDYLGGKSTRFDYVKACSHHYSHCYNL